MTRVRSGDIEDVGRRGFRSKTYRRGENYVTHVRGQPFHWHDGSVFRDIDLTPIDIGDYYRATQGLYLVSVYKNGIGFDYESRNGGTINTELVGSFNLPVLDDSNKERVKFTWINAFRGVDVEIQLRPSGVWTYTTIKSPSAVHNFTWSLVQSGLSVSTPVAVGVDEGRISVDIVDGIGQRFISINTQDQYPVILR